MPVTLNAAVTLQTEKSRYQPTADEQNTKRSNQKEKKKISLSSVFSHPICS